MVPEGNHDIHDADSESIPVSYQSVANVTEGQHVYQITSLEQNNIKGIYKVLLISLIILCTR
jgi:hypothetical protein